MNYVIAYVTRPPGCWSISRLKTMSSRLQGVGRTSAPLANVIGSIRTPNNYLSGVYYVQTQPGADTISFEDPRPQINVISPRVSEYVPENAWEMHVGVKEGQLVLFPAWLPHAVARNTSDKERISVSFNIMFPNFGRIMCAPKWQGNVPTPRALSRET